MLLDKDLLRAKIFHGLKSRQLTYDTLSPRFLEISICESFGFLHVGDSAYYADGIKLDEGIQCSIKTRALNPQNLKIKLGRDFQSHPNKFLGPYHIKKHNKWTNGLEIVQRRQQLNFINDSVAPADEVGTATIEGFNSNIQQSYQKYNTHTSYEIISAHGYNYNFTSYIISLFWKKYESLNAHDLFWSREGIAVCGYAEFEGTRYKVCERINGNAKREATCFKEYKNLIKFDNQIHLQIPIPNIWEFNKDKILTEMLLIESPEPTDLSTL